MWKINLRKFRMNINGFNEKLDKKLDEKLDEKLDNLKKIGC
jgi:hypothetical protein